MNNIVVVFPSLFRLKIICITCWQVRLDFKTWIEATNQLCEKIETARPVKLD